MELKLCTRKGIKLKKSVDNIFEAVDSDFFKAAYQVFHDEVAPTAIHVLVLN